MTNVIDGVELRPVIRLLIFDTLSSGINITIFMGNIYLVSTYYTIFLRISAIRVQKYDNLLGSLSINYLSIEYTVQHHNV